MIPKNKKIISVIFLLFLVSSFLFISPVVKSARSNYHSSELKKVTTRDENTVRTDYVDENGRITVAANLGYATEIATKTDHGKLEQYYDDQGEPVRRSSGYYGVLREYDENGNNIRNTYLNLQGNPVVMASGYAIEERTYNENKQVTLVRYYDAEGTPVFTASYGYGKNNEYDENGNNSRVVYIDASDQPMMIKQGYAIISYNRYLTEGPENEKVESEFYFDEEGKPVALSLGQYGVHKEYDEYGRESVWTYLDMDGNPMVTNKGYTTVRQTFHANGSVATEQYYDLEGNPYALSEGQYGIKTEGGQTFHLNERGDEKFNLKTLLYNQSWLAIVLALIVVLLSSVADKRMNFLLLILYLCAIAYLTLMFRESDESGSHLRLLWSYRYLFSDSEKRADILKNIWLFIPLGAILYRLYPKKEIFLVPVAFSLLIEMIQYAAGVGICELDDIVSNSLGGWIGFAGGQLLAKLWTNRRENGSILGKR